MVSKTNFILYLFVFSLFVVLKILFSMADISDIIFLISPTNSIVEVFTGTSAQFIAEKGFFYETLNIIINKSCSGFNFWLLSFLILTFLTIDRLTKVKKQILAIPILFLSTFLITILVNASRILFSLKIDYLLTMFNYPKYDWLHQAEGVLIYLTYLIIMYLALNYLLVKKTKNNEKLA